MGRYRWHHCPKGGGQISSNTTANLKIRMEERTIRSQQQTAAKSLSELAQRAQCTHQQQEEKKEQQETANNNDDSDSDDDIPALGHRMGQDGYSDSSSDGNRVREQSRFIMSSGQSWCRHSHLKPIRFCTMILFMLAIVIIFLPLAISKSPSMLPQKRRIHEPQSTSSPTTKPAVFVNRIRPLSSSLTSISSSNEAPWISGMKNSLASALAAGCSKLILAPFDTIKTLQQHSRNIGNGDPLTLIQAAQVIMKRPKGILEFYAGVGVAVIGSMPSVGLYFGIYSFCKKTFQQYDPKHYEQRQTLYIALSAAIGNTVASASRVPYEVIKQKFQTNVYTTMGDAIRDLSWTTLFPMGGIASQMLRDIPYAIVTLLTYEHLKKVWKPRIEKNFPQVPKRAWDLLVGGLAGGVGSYVTNPMDVIKTRLQTDVSGSLYSGSIATCAENTWQEGGPSAFLRGSVPRLLHKVPANAFFFLFYEFFRSILRVQDDTTRRQ